MLFYWREAVLGRLATALSSRPGVFLVLSVGLLGLGAWAVPSLEPSPAFGKGKRVAVVGAGASGMHAAWMLDRSGADVTVFEASPYVGGHAYSYPFEDDEGTIHPVDVGFIFGSPILYKEMKALLAWHGVERQITELDLSATIDGKTWATGMDDLDPEVLRLRELANRHYDDPRLDLVPFGMWLSWNDFDMDFAREYLTPLMVVLFITERGFYEVSTRFVLNMLAGPTKWLDYTYGAQAWTVEGGSSKYYGKLSESLAGKIRLLTPVTGVDRRADGTVLIEAQSPAGKVEETFDAVVLAVHADVSRRLLRDASWFEDFVLGQIRYEPAELLVHTDTSAFPEGDLRRHYSYVDNDGVGGGFELHSLPVLAQGGHEETSPSAVLTLNPQREYEGVRLRRNWRHHYMDLWHLAMVLKLLPAMQGAGNVWYAGDWVTFIGHGPAITSGLKAACAIAGEGGRDDLSVTPCIDVVLEDENPAEGKGEHRVQMCGERDVHAFLVEAGCRKKGPI